MIFYIIIGIVFASIVLMILSLGLIVFTKKTPKSAISGVSYYDTGPKKETESASFFDRVGAPMFRKLSVFVKIISPKGIVESAKHKLELAGVLEKVGPDVFLGIKFLMPIVFLFIFIILSIFFSMPLLIRIILIALIPLSYFFPDVYLNGRIKNRQEEIRVTLPGALDLLTISIEAGMGFDTALSKVAGNIKGALADEFNRMLQDMHVGLSRKEAFRNLGRRTDVSDLTTFIGAMIQADVLGVSIGKVLRVQAGEMRTRRRQRAEETGIKTPVKMVFPLILCLLPALMTIILGPAIIRIMEMLLTMGAP